MIIITSTLQALKKSKFYDKECWDYPKEEKTMLEKSEEYAENVYVQAEDERIYETYCKIEQVKELIEELKEKNRTI